PAAVSGARRLGRADRRAGCRAAGVARARERRGGAPGAGRGARPVSRSLAWLLLVVAGLLDVAWAISMKYADGYRRPGWTLLSLALLGSFVWLLGRALAVLPVGTAYAVWTGIGAIGTAVLGV